VTGWTLKADDLSQASFRRKLATAGEPERLEMKFELTGMLRAEMVFKEPVGAVPGISGGRGNLEVEGRVVKASYPLMQGEV